MRFGGRTILTECFTALLDLSLEVADRLAGRFEFLEHLGASGFERFGTFFGCGDLPAGGQDELVGPGAGIHQHPLCLQLGRPHRLFRLPADGVLPVVRLPLGLARDDQRVPLGRLQDGGSFLGAVLEEFV